MSADPQRDPSDDEGLGLLTWMVIAVMVVICLIWPCL